MAAMTSKQRDLILMLAGQLLGESISYLDKAASVLPVSKSALRRGLTMPEASACIDDLRKQIENAEKQAEKQETTPVIIGTLAAEGILALLGRDVEITYTAPDGEPRTVSGKVDSIVLSSKDGTPALRFTALPLTVRASVVTAWRVL
jgi:hypothetical protein